MVIWTILTQATSRLAGTIFIRHSFNWPWAISINRRVMVCLQNKGLLTLVEGRLCKQSLPSKTEFPYLGYKTLFWGQIYTTDARSLLSTALFRPFPFEISNKNFVWISCLIKYWKCFLRLTTFRLVPSDFKSKTPSLSLETRKKLFQYLIKFIKCAKHWCMIP